MTPGEKIRDALATVIRTIGVAIMLGGVFVLASWCTGCTNGQFSPSKAQSIACAGAQAVQALMCGGGPLGGLISGTSGGEDDAQHDPERGGIE